MVFRIALVALSLAIIGGVGLILWAARLPRAKAIESASQRRRRLAEASRRRRTVARDFGVALVTGAVVGGLILSYSEAQENRRMGQLEVLENTRFVRALSEQSREEGLGFDIVLSGMDLRGTNLSGLSLSDVDFDRVNLEGANLDRTDLTGSDLTNANLRGASLVLADLRGTAFVNSDLTGANLASVKTDRSTFMVNVDLTDALLGVSLYVGRHPCWLAGSTLDRTELTYSVLWDTAESCDPDDTPYWFNTPYPRGEPTVSFRNTWWCVGTEPFFPDWYTPNPNQARDCDAIERYEP